MGLLDNKSSNPLLQEKLLDDYEFATDRTMTVNGTIAKTAILLLITTITAVFSWEQMIVMPNLYGVLFVTMLIGFGMVIFGMRKPQYAHIIAPLYAFVEGIFVGVISAIYGYLFDGIVLNAVLLTFGTLFVMLFVYRTGIIKVTQKFRSIMIVAISSIGLLYMAAWILGFWGIQLPMLAGNGMLAIGTSVVITVVASLSLLLDFDMIENNVKQGAPKSFEWVGSMALLVTIVWLYLEFLRLLSKLQD